MDESESKGLIDRGQKLSMSTIESLAYSLWKFQPYGIVVCDVGIAYQLIDYWHMSDYPAIPLVFSYVPYNERYQLGFVTDEMIYYGDRYVLKHLMTVGKQQMAES